MENNNTIEEEIINRMISDKSFRMALVRKSHYWFFHYYFGPDYVKYPTADFQREIFSLTEDTSIQNLIITAFRGSSKSTLITLSYVIWSIMGVQQKKFPLILGQTQFKAQIHLQAIKRELEQNDRLRGDLGPFREENNQWGAQSLILPLYGAKISIGSVDQSIRGIRHNQHRPDVIVCDDLEDQDSVRTQESRDKIFRWIVGDVIPSGDRSTRLIFIGTPLHRDSLLARLEKLFPPDEPQNAIRKYPILNSDSKCTWPGKFPNPEDIESEKKRIGDLIAWQREYMLNIVSEHDQIITPEDIHFYESMPHKDMLSAIYVGMDLAISKRETADQTAMIIGWVFIDSNEGKQYVYIDELTIIDRMNFTETVTACKYLRNSLYRTMDPIFLIEDVGYQKSLSEQLITNDIQAEAVKIGTLDKRSRLNLASDLIRSGGIKFHMKNKELINQIVGFGTERHDDAVDAFTLLALKVIENPPVTATFAWIG